jgi:hypothetical protein
MSPTRAPSRELSITADVRLLSADDPVARLVIDGAIDGMLVSGPVGVRVIAQSEDHAEVLLEHRGETGWVLCTAWGGGVRATRIIAAVG